MSSPYVELEDPTGSIRFTGYLLGNVLAQQVWVPSTGVAATDTAAIQAAHDAFTTSGGTILLDPGPYALTGGSLNFTKPIHLIGTGPNGPNVSGTSANSYVTQGTKLTCASGSTNALTINADGCTLQNLYFLNTSGTTPTAGAAVQVVTHGTGMRILDCSFDSFYINVDFVQGFYWLVDRCWFWNPVLYGLKIQDTYNADYGDMGVTNSYFQPNGRSSTAAVYWQSGGGLRFIGNKINGGGAYGNFTNGIEFDTGGGQTGTVTIAANSIENITTGILVQTSNIRYGAVVGNEFLYSGTAINLHGTTGWQIHGNARNGTAVFDVALNSATNVVIGPHVGLAVTYAGSNTGLSFQGVPYTTVGRPSAASFVAGASYYDTTLTKPGFSDGTVWRDAAGNTI